MWDDCVKIREGKKTHLEQHGGREVAELEEVDVDVHVVRQLPPPLLLLLLGVAVMLVPTAHALQRRRHDII